MFDEKIINALTFDIEDYYQVSAFNDVINREDWGSFESRVNKNTRIILDILDRYEIKATFFILGVVAEKNKTLVKEIHAGGHEVASHGYSHKLVYEQTKKEFREETIKSKSILEEIVSSDVKGYRAASYSITKDSLWALDVLQEAGFKYDSSIFPTYHDRYGIPDFSRDISVIKYQNKIWDLVEFPITTSRLLGYNFPASGGGYFRIYPEKFLKYLLNRVNNKEKVPFMFYLHPWEFDPGQPKIKNISKFTEFRHYHHLSKTTKKFESLINDFSFDRVDSILKSLGFKL